MRYIVVVVLSMLVLCQPYGARAQMRQIADEITAFTPLSPTEILVANADGRFKFIDLESGKKRSWVPEWIYAQAGWDGASAVIQLELSPDGKWIMYAQMVWLDGELSRSPNAPFILRNAVAVVVCRPDGTGARCIGLGIDVGGGPQFDFTQDSKGVFGQPFLPCEPTVPAFVEFTTNGWPDTDENYYNYVDLESGNRILLEGLEISDGYYECPYSDNVAGTDWFSKVWFSNVAENELTGGLDLIESDVGLTIDAWVLQDAVLASWLDVYALVYTDGAVAIDGSERKWRMYCWLPNGTYLFSEDDGETIKYGKVDWSSFTVDWWVDRSDLLPYLRGNAEALPDSSGIIFRRWDSGALFYTPVSRKGAKP